MKFELGSSVKDILTGFSGVVTGRVSYITGCDRYLIQPKMQKNGDYPSSEWIDDSRLNSIKKAIVTLDIGHKPGACEAAPIK